MSRAVSFASSGSLAAEPVNWLTSSAMPSQVFQRIDPQRLGIDGFHDRARVLAAAVALPCVRQLRFLQHGARPFGDDFYLRPERIRRMFRRHDRELLRT